MRSKRSSLFEERSGQRKEAVHYQSICYKKSTLCIVRPRERGVRGYAAPGPGVAVGARGDEILKNLKLLSISQEKCVHFSICGK